MSAYLVTHNGKPTSQAYTCFTTAKTLVDKLNSIDKRKKWNLRIITVHTSEVKKQEL